MDTPTEDQAAGPALPVAADTASATPAAAVPAAPEEDNVIDSAWIKQAKQIIAATAGDPYKQSQQLAALKSDYLHKRYAKQIKAAGDD